MEKLMQPGQLRRSEAGFTVVEAMIALGILAFGILTLATMQLAALSQGAAGRHSHDAAAISRTAAEQIHRLPWSEITNAQAAGTWTAAVWPGASDTVDADILDAAGNTATYKTYTVQWKVDDVLDASSAQRPCLRDIQVRVSWPEEKMSNDKTFSLIVRRFNWGGSSC